MRCTNRLHRHGSKRKPPAHRRSKRNWLPMPSASKSSCRNGSNHSGNRSEEHTSELQSLMRNSYAVFCLKKHMRLIEGDVTYAALVKSVVRGCGAEGQLAV